MSSVEGVDDGSTGYGVLGRSNNNVGVVGESHNSYGVYGLSNRRDGVVGSSFYGAGVRGSSNYLDGVLGYSYSGNGVAGHSYTGIGVYGYSYRNVAIFGQAELGIGISGYSLKAEGVVGYSQRNAGVYGQSATGDGLYGVSERGYGLYANSRAGKYAARIDGGSLLGGDVWIAGNLNVGGMINKAAVQFKIDHPLDPANKYLYHSSVESPDMKNMYDGVVELDQNGEAKIELPDWFGALNKDFRYQLTAIGASGPNLFIAEEISGTDVYSSGGSEENNKVNTTHFKIAGGSFGMKVSWQITGIRKDPWAKANRVKVEEDKPAKERGYYLNPALYDQPEENGIQRLFVPEEKRLGHLIYEHPT